MRKTSRLLEVMQQLGITTKEIAASVHLDARTINNISCGSSTSHRGRQAITNILDTVIWPEIKPHAITFPVGMQIIDMTPEHASRAIKEFGDCVALLGNTIEFIKPVRVVISSLKMVARGDRPQRNVIKNVGAAAQ